MKNKDLDEKFTTKLNDLGRMDRRTFVKMAGVAAGAIAFGGSFLRHIPSAAAQIAGGSLDPTTIPKYVDSLAIPPVMPRTSEITENGVLKDYYEIAVRQFTQQILPPGMPATTVWSYGSINHAGTFNYPAFTVEAAVNKPVRVKWINDLKDASGNFLPHLLPVDQTLHWANPPGGIDGRDMAGTSQQPYAGPVPIVVHLHGGHTTEESDGFPEAWFLPYAANIDPTFAKVGSEYDAFKAKFEAEHPGVTWEPGTAVFEYNNEQRAATLWYHDHALGMTRTNVYAGPAGFYLLRGGPGDLNSGVLPSGAYEIPIVIQDRSFNDDGSLFYPDNRAFFEGLNVPGQPQQSPSAGVLDIPFIPDQACDGLASDIPPIWNPEFFGNAMVVNGKTWPFLNVEKRRYRFRFLNGSDSRFFILKMENGMPFWQIGADGGFLRTPVKLNQLLLGPAERADVIIDFTKVPVDTSIILQNIGPDEPFGGGTPGVDFVPADPGTTGQVLQFRVINAVGKDTTTPPDKLMLPAIRPLGRATTTRQVSLNEDDSATVRVATLADGSIVLDCTNGVAFGPARARLGTLKSRYYREPVVLGRCNNREPGAERN